jgi:hypothetical protein
MHREWQKLGRCPPAVPGMDEVTSPDLQQTASRKPLAAVNLPFLKITKQLRLSTD